MIPKLPINYGFTGKKYEYLYYNNEENRLKYKTYKNKKNKKQL